MSKSKSAGDSSQSGRPRYEKDQLQKRRNVMLSDRLADKAAEIGSGNVSKGIRIAVEEYDNSYAIRL